MGKIRNLFAFVLLIYAISPIVFKYSPFIRRSLLFMNRVNTQFNFNLSRPEELGIKCSRTLRLTYTLDENDDAAPLVSEVELGAWHILPESSLPHCFTVHNDNRTMIEDKGAFAGSRPIVLYVHGNGGTRGGDHRGKLYRRLAYEHDYHIVTFDYRGYGDSTDLQPTRDGVSSDARAMYEWLLKQPGVSKERIIVWGHSLGTAVAIKMVAELPLKIKPSRLILEAPFDSVANAVAGHPFSAPFRIIPYFERFFIEPIVKSPELNFDSLSVVADIKPTPLMILHAEDDAIIPLKLGRNLYKVAVQALGEANVKFIQLGADLGLGHKYICVHDETMIKVKQFIEHL